MIKLYSLVLQVVCTTCGTLEDVHNIPSVNEFDLGECIISYLDTLTSDEKLFISVNEIINKRQ